MRKWADKLSYFSFIYSFVISVEDYFFKGYWPPLLKNLFQSSWTEFGSVNQAYFILWAYVENLPTTFLVFRYIIISK